MQAWKCSTPASLTCGTRPPVGSGAGRLPGTKSRGFAVPLGAGRRVAGRSYCELPRSNLKSHTNDCLSDRAQAGVVVAGVSAHELVGVIDRDRFPVGGDPLGLFDDDP